MNDDRKTLAALLRERSVFEDADASAPDPGWRETLLADLDLAAPLPRVAQPAAAAAPLRLRHVGLMAPFGAALFLAGYWFGTEGVSAAELARIHPAWWMGIALGVATASLFRFGRPRFRR